MRRPIFSFRGNAELCVDQFFYNFILTPPICHFLFNYRAHTIPKVIWNGDTHLTDLCLSSGNIDLELATILTWLFSICKDHYIFSNSSNIIEYFTEQCDLFSICKDQDIFPENWTSAWFQPVPKNSSTSHSIIDILLNRCLLYHMFLPKVILQCY